MVNLIILRNPFDRTKKETQKIEYKKNKPITYYFNEMGDWHFSINGVLVDKTTIVKDGEYIGIVPVVGRRYLGAILSIGLTVLTGGIASGTINLGMNAFWRGVTAAAVGMIGGSLVAKWTAPRPDLSQSNKDGKNPDTYRWDTVKNVVGQGYPLAITYGKVKNAGLILSRHVERVGKDDYLHLVIGAGMGELDNISNIEINGNDISSYSNVTYEIRLGTHRQDILNNIMDNWNDYPVNFKLKPVKNSSDARWVTQKLQGDNNDAFEVVIYFPRGLYRQDRDNLVETEVNLEMQYRVDKGIWKEFFRGRIVSKSTSEQSERRNPFSNVYRVNNLPKGTVEIRMKRTDNNDGIFYATDCYWVQFSQFVNVKLRRPNKALLGLKIKANEQLSGGEPVVTFIQERNTIYAYNPNTREYEPYPANNPAWACYDMLHQARRINDEYIVYGEPKERLIFDKFYSWAKDCEKKNIKFNYLFDTAGQLWEQLKIPETVGRGKVLMQGTRFTCVYDFKAEPSQLFNVGNIKKDSFNEDFRGLMSRANVVEISFLNEAKNYERDLIPVYGDDFDITDRNINPVQVELMGCTSLDQAVEYGRHYLKANELEVRTCTFEAFQDAIACTVGDVILLSHDMTNWGVGGRIVRGGVGTVILDRVVDNIGVNHQLLIRDNNTDELKKYTVTRINNDALTLDTTDNIPDNSLYILGRKETDIKPFRVMSITKGMNDVTRKITCVEYYDRLYAVDFALRYRYEYKEMNKNKKTTSLVVYWEKPQKAIKNIVLNTIIRFNDEENTTDNDSVNIDVNKTEYKIGTTYEEPIDPNQKRYEEEHGLDIYWHDFEIIVTFTDDTQIKDAITVANFDMNDYLNARRKYLAEAYGEELYTDTIKTGKTYIVPYDGIYEVTAYSDTAYLPDPCQYEYKEEKMKHTRQFTTKILKLTKGQIISVTGGKTKFKAELNETLEIPRYTTSTSFGGLLESGVKEISPHGRVANIYSHIDERTKTKHLYIIYGGYGSYRSFDQAMSYDGYCTVQYRVKNNRAYSLISSENGETTVVGTTENAFNETIRPPYTRETMQRYINIPNVNVVDVHSDDRNLDQFWQYVELDKVIIWDDYREGIRTRDFIPSFGNTNPNNYIGRGVAERPLTFIYSDKTHDIVPFNTRKTKPVNNWMGIDTNNAQMGWYYDYSTGETVPDERELMYFIPKEDGYYVAFSPYTIRYLGWCYQNEKIYRLTFGGYKESALWKYR